MAQTPAQNQYDADLEALSRLTGVERIRAKEQFDLKYPDGKPKGTANESVDGSAEALAFGLTESLIGAFPELREVYDLFLKKDYDILVCNRKIKNRFLEKCLSIFFDSKYKITRITITLINTI